MVVQAFQHELGGSVHVTTPALQRLREFHGHVGPYVVLGFRAGELAREILESPGYFDLTVKTTCPLQTPRSCFLDGVQLGSGCTVGKRNLSFRSGEPIGGLFQSKKNGKAVRIRLKEGLPEKIRAWIEASGVEETGEKVMGLPR
ncbi:MAG: formylmethanofuran dehydrogenase subunit E family protein, partial [Myxococcales bacterium]